MPSPGPTVSVVLATFRRPTALARLLRSLRVQDGAPTYEVVVVDNDPDGSARDVVARELPEARYLVEPTPGAAHARNRGYEAAHGDVVALTDDDVEAYPDWLARLTEPVLSGTADAVGGRVVLDPAVPRPRWFDERGIGGYVTSFPAADELRPLQGREYFVTANAACRRGLLLAVGGIRPGLSPEGATHWAGDDVRLTRDLLAAGARVWFAPDAVVVHEFPAERLRRRWLLQRAYLQGRSDWRMERDELTARRLNGARVATSWLRAELARRGAEGWGSPAVRFHAACDVVRTAGALREAASWGRPARG